MTDKNNILKNIPQVEKILNYDSVGPYTPLIGHAIVVKIIREETENFRKAVTGGNNLKIEDLIQNIERRCKEKQLEKLQSVINATGVIIHTNLGRSPLGPDLSKKLQTALSGYCNLELHLPSQKRGKRGGFAEELMCELTGAEDALIVNNNASSVFLILNCLASGKEVIVSRGELIQIGGGFRIPDIMAQTGALLHEVGATNITTLDDFKNAINENTGMILSAHQSNYRIQGFTEMPSLKELASLKSDSILAVRDLGSGNLVSDKSLPRPFEPTISSELSQGMDLVCFSGDKLLGGPQSGIIVGRKDLIAKLRRHPLMRMIRVDKITYYLLQEVLLHYINGTITDLPIWNIILNNKQLPKKRINRLMVKLRASGIDHYLIRTETKSTYGGGAMPAVEIESEGIRIIIPRVRADDIYTFFVHEPVPVIGTVADGAYTLDFMTVLDQDINQLAQSIDRCISHFTR